jgi:hypothetical protein
MPHLLIFYCLWPCFLFSLTAKCAKDAQRNAKCFHSLTTVSTSLLITHLPTGLRRPKPLATGRRQVTHCILDAVGREVLLPAYCFLLPASSLLHPHHTDLHVHKFG